MKQINLKRINITLSQSYYSVAYISVSDMVLIYIIACKFLKEPLSEAATICPGRVSRKMSCFVPLHDA